MVKPAGTGQTDLRHLRETGTLPSEEIAPFAVPFRFTCTKEIDPLFHGTPHLVFDCGTDALPTALIWDWSAPCRRADNSPKENCLRNSALLLCLSTSFPGSKVKLEHVGAPTICVDVMWRPTLQLADSRPAHGQPEIWLLQQTCMANSASRRCRLPTFFELLLLSLTPSGLSGFRSDCDYIATGNLRLEGLSYRYLARGG